MIKNLVIVESPAKAKTIEKFLGKDFIVKSCYGHIRDLAPHKLSVDVNKSFAPEYEIPDDKKKIVDELKKLSKEAELIWLATDEDREGEAISWHLKEALKLQDKDIRRIVFHEITKTAILKAIENPRSIDNNLVDAQQARRILDRLVGFELSPVLWKKIKPALSAGRVQSVAVRLIVEREREIIKFKQESYFKVTATFFIIDENGKKQETLLKAEYPGKFPNSSEAKEYLEKCIGKEFHISEIEVKPAQKSPSAPFITSTLQQEASRKLNYSVSRTMTLAQKLYEAGHITYMRTDSTNLSELAMDAITDEIGSRYGKEYHNKRQYATKSKGAQEAHEAIRPTYMNKDTAGSSDAEKRLYDLIWKRTIASQMANARLERTTVKINADGVPGNLVAEGEVLKFEGFLKVYLEGRDDEDEEQKEDNGMLPPLHKGQKLDFKQMAATEKFNRPPARYTEASLVKKLEELGIGRPSTYAPTISTIQKRQYVEKSSREGEKRNYNVLKLHNNNITNEVLTENHGAEKNKLFPTNIGIIVNDFLQVHFQNIMDYSFTAKVEKQFDEIAQGEKEWQHMLKDFYKNFHDKVEETLTSERANNDKTIGVDPTTGKTIYAKIGKFGPYVQLGETDTENKPKYAKLKAGQLIETITLEDALELFKMPRELGEHAGNPVIVDIGRFGPYIKYQNSFYSIPKDIDPYQIGLEEAVNLVETKIQENAKKTIKVFDHKGKEVKILNGRFGPYVALGKQNASIPKGTNPESLSLEEALQILENKKNKPAKAGGRKKKS